MKSSAYLIWFRRLLLLGAVVAGTTASAAGAVGQPPDVRDAAAANLQTLIGSPPDVRDAAAAVSATNFSGIGLKALSASTPLSRPPDVRDTASVVNAPVPDVFERYVTAHPYGIGLSEATQSLLSRPPDIRDAVLKASQLNTSQLNVSQPTPVERIIAQERGRHADLGLFGSYGLSAPTQSSLVSRPPDVTDAAQAAQDVSFGQSSGFDWADYGIGIGSGIGLTLILGLGMAMGLQRRHRMQTA